jgi:hypothetical protein
LLVLRRHSEPKAKNPRIYEGSEATRVPKQHRQNQPYKPISINNLAKSIPKSQQICMSSPIITQIAHYKEDVYCR